MKKNPPNDLFNKIKYLVNQIVVIKLKKDNAELEIKGILKINLKDYFFYINTKESENDQFFADIEFKLSNIENINKNIINIKSSVENELFTKQKILKDLYSKAHKGNIKRNYNDLYELRFDHVNVIVNYSTPKLSLNISDYLHYDERKEYYYLDTINRKYSLQFNKENFLFAVHRVDLFILI